MVEEIVEVEFLCLDNLSITSQLIFHLHIGEVEASNP